MDNSFIKWTGSKKFVSELIVKQIKTNKSKYVEPFIGGGSMFFEVLSNNSLKFKEYLINDNNKNLIDLYLTVKNNYNELYRSYVDNYNIFNSDLYDGDLYENRKKYFNILRNKYNKDKNDFLTFYSLTRFAYNGIIRFNGRGDYNSSCHFSRPGMEPVKVEKLLAKYNQLLNNKNVIISNVDYKDIIIDSDSFVYLDPPYINSKELYNGTFNNNDFIDYLKVLDKKQVEFICSYDSHYEIDFLNKVLIKEYQSSFKRLVNSNKADSDNLSQEYIFTNLKNQL